MLRRILLLALVFSAVPGLCRDKIENWVEVRSEHFIVATNSNEKKARQIADQFERMRSVFHVAFPKLQIDPPAPIIVLAIKDEKDFRSLEPAAYLAKGQLKLGGLFLRAPDKNYVLMRLDAEGEHPYEVVYHEYTHLLLSKSAEWMPLWLNEGLAEFYQNTEIHEKDVSLGQPSAENIILLRQNRLLPLPTLFTVDAKSPYYHEENKGSIFYAESWALTHYIEFKDFQEKSQRLTDYGTLLAQKVDPVTAATRAFGDLNRLQDGLDRYVHGQAGFSFFKMKAATEIDDTTFKAQALSAAEADALQADFLAYNDRGADARSLLDRVLKEDPKNVSAHETMGFLEFRDGHLDEARRWYAQAVQLDSQSYLAHYYFAAMTLNGSLGSTDNDAQVESSLRSAIKLNPSFAPAFDLLAVFLGMRHRDLDNAHILGLTAVSLEPGNVRYRINVAQVLLEMGQGSNAVRVLDSAAKMAKTPEDVQAVDGTLRNAQAFAAAQEQASQQQRAMAAAKPGGAPGESVEASASVEGPTLSHRDTFVAKGPHHFLTGTLKNVHCNNPQLDLTVDDGGKGLALHAENYYKIQFTALNFAPSSDLNPCKDLEGRLAKVEYVESADTSATARVIAIELHK
jgi:tetratricopeptide (TPR) repeat protein